MSLSAIDEVTALGHATSWLQMSIYTTNLRTSEQSQERACIQLRTLKGLSNLAERSTLEVLAQTSSVTFWGLDLPHSDAAESAPNSFQKVSLRLHCCSAQGTSRCPLRCGSSPFLLECHGRTISSSRRSHQCVGYAVEEFHGCTQRSLKETNLQIWLLPYERDLSCRPPQQCLG
jgi:hypothetical protein